MARARSNRGRRQSLATTALTISVGVAATLGVAIYLVSTSLPYLVDSPAGDPQFGPLNRCLISQLREPRAGFAVAPGGLQVAAYGASSVAVCERVGPAVDAGILPAGVLLPLAGVTAASFDFEGTLWLSAAHGPRPELWAAPSPRGALRKVGDFAPVALVGLPSGVAALDASGRLASFTLGGPAPQFTAVPAGSSAALASNLDGNLLSVVTANAVHVLRSSDLSVVRSESACPAQFLWWLTVPTRALIACGPEAGSTLLIDVGTGLKESAPAAKRPRSALVPRLGSYVQSCDQLPCSAQPPQLTP